MAQSRDAESSLRRCLQIWESEHGKQHLDVATCLNNLGLTLTGLGRYREAEAAFNRSLTIREANVSADHPVVAVVVDNLAMLYMILGRYSEAESFFRRSLRIREERLGNGHPVTASSLNNLAALCSDLGRYAEAEANYRRCLKIRSDRLGKDHPLTVTTLNNLAQVYLRLERFEEAETLLRQGREMTETRVGANDPANAATLNALAILHQRKGALAEAETLLRKCLDIITSNLGNSHPQTATALNNLGILYCQQMRFELAEEHLLKALALTRAAYGNNHTEVATTLVSLGTLYEAMGQHEKALEMQIASLEIDEAIAQNVFAFSSEAAMFEFLKTSNGALPGIVTMAANHSESNDSVSAAFSWMLRRKGMVFDVLCRHRQAQQSLKSDPAVTRKVARYRTLKESLANAALKPPTGVNADEAKKQIAQWQTEAADLESQLHRFLSNTAPASAAVTIAAVQQRLAADAVLVDFIRCPVRDFKADDWKAAHYFAFVLSAHDRAPRLVDLGAAKNIDSLVGRLRQQFTDFQEKLGDCETKAEIAALEVKEEAAYRKVAEELCASLFAPLQKVLGNSTMLHLAPDGELNRLPFEALVGSDGKYLVEKYRFTYLSNGRDLLRTPNEARHGTLVFANPDFRAAADDRRATAAELLPKSEQVAVDYPLEPQVRSIGWRSLPGALLEAKDIQESLANTNFGPVKSYTGNQALEEVFKRMAAPRILHLATHGFFLDHEPDVPSSEGAGAGWARRQLKRADNPLLRSGIILAGANNVGTATSTTGVDDGWLTSEEIALLNLHGTELVVLSACQTGLGDVKSGEGVYGLRRVFLYAGVRTMISSLFEVPDGETRDLMRRFYAGLKGGQGKLQALHTAQRDTIRERRQVSQAAHPFFWASFVLVGDPG